MNEFFKKRATCPCCDSKQVVEIFRVPFDQPALQRYVQEFYGSQGAPKLSYLENQDYVLSRCVQCQLIFQCEIPADKLMYSIYEEWIDPELVFEKTEKNRGIGYFEQMSREIVRIVNHFGGSPSQINLLDYGMGWGHWCRLAQSFGCNVFGTEYSASRIEHAGAIGLGTYKLDCLPKRTFDFINTEQVFEHLPHPKETLLELKECLKPGGLLKISVPLGDNIDRKLHNLSPEDLERLFFDLNPIAPLEHINCYSRACLTDFASRNGLTPAKLSYRKKLDFFLTTLERMLTSISMGLRPSRYLQPSGNKRLYMLFRVSD